MITLRTTVLLLAFQFFFKAMVGQFTSAEIGVNGLTCSQCSRSVELALKKLSFIQDVQMDLEHTQGKISFKPGEKIYFEKMARAVQDAGFSVRYLTVGFTFHNVMVSDGTCFPFENRAYRFTKTNSKTLDGEVRLKLIGKDFLPKPEFNTWKPELKSGCEAPERMFYVTPA